MLDIISKRIKDSDVLWLLKEIINSFSPGLPIGNLTSQIFANIYLNEFDQFVKNDLRVKNYCRYTDDFVTVSEDKQYLLDIIRKISIFLSNKLRLEIHPKKVIIRKFHQGIDFLGYVSLPFYTSLRTKTRNRIFNKLRKRIKEYKSGIISEQTLEQSLQSYLGVLSHANTHELSEKIRNQYWFWLKE